MLMPTFLNCHFEQLLVIFRPLDYDFRSQRTNLCKIGLVWFRLGYCCQATLAISAQNFHGDKTSILTYVLGVKGLNNGKTKIIKNV